MQYRIDLCDLEHLHNEELDDEGQSDFFGETDAGPDYLGISSKFMDTKQPFFPISGEFHYSRVHECRWEDEIIKMRMGGINIISTYVFWNHIEEEEGVFDFTGRRDLRRFVKLCAKHGLYVILRVGPFAHGEARNGGLPDWLYSKPFEVRHTNEGFMACVRHLYEKIGEQVKGLFFKDSGPIIAVQLDNEYMHSSAMWEPTVGVSNEWVFKGDEGEKYLLCLRELALSSGLTPVFFTSTAWGGAAYSSRILPMWGGYAYWPWIFKDRNGKHPATPGYVYEDYLHNGQSCVDDFAPAYDPETRPYFCCEIGGGMSCTYNSRFTVDYRSVDAMANVKLGSGCNFLGYYMYHGGTNPVGKNGMYLNESHVPKRSYDYQAPIGEYGQIRESYGRLRTLHMFLHDFAEDFLDMDPILPKDTCRSPEDTKTLRYTLRYDTFESPELSPGGFLFINNFQDHLTLPPRNGDTVMMITDEEFIQSGFSIGSGENAILPINFYSGHIILNAASVQPVLETTIKGRTTVVFLQPDGMKATFSFERGAKASGSLPFFTVKNKYGDETDILVLSRAQTNQLYRIKDGSLILTRDALLEDPDGRLRLETTEASLQVRCYPDDRLAAAGLRRLPNDGIWGVYELKTEARNLKAVCTPAASHRFTISLPQNILDGLKDVRLQISYRGDIGMLFLNNELISDNFCNGEVWEIGLLEYRELLDTGTLVLNISPVRKDAVIDANSPMAGRSETSSSEIAELLSVKIQPVYEFTLLEAAHE